TKRKTDIPSKCLSLFVPDPCAAPPVVGPCKGVFSRWYYDSKTGDCQHFQYGGCKGNHNNFLQKSDCINDVGGNTLQVI
uniref:BPTI/Kunitz inhibitor domain-containing protein n=1 Tax=Sinocyclocheilus rhinocerous TaxID=307959 RepID=A0A673KPF2_9TELE